MTEKIGMMELITYERIFKEFTPTSIKLNWRGEPLLHKDIVAMVRIAKEYGVHEVALNTNATLLDDTTLQAFNMAGLDQLIISMDGATKGTYEKIRKGADYETVCKNIIRAKLIFRGHIRIQICPQPDNLHEIELWKEIFGQYADKLRVGKLHDPQGKRNYKIEQPKTCAQPWRRMTIAWDGDCFPCCGDYLGKVRLGNINDDSIKNMWDSSKMEHIRYMLRTYGRKSVSPCKYCSSYC